MKASLESMESKHSLADNELRQMQTNLRDYEQLVEEYRTQVCRFLVSFNTSVAPLRLEHTKLRCQNMQCEHKVQKCATQYPGI